jgi:uncharacterized membrane protein YczE
VLQEGIVRRLGVLIGWVVIAVSALVLVVWIPLGQRPGFGTVSNVVVVGLVVTAALDVIPSSGPVELDMAMLDGAVLVNGAATAC